MAVLLPSSREFCCRGGGNKTTAAVHEARMRQQLSFKLLVRIVKAVVTRLETAIDTKGMLFW